MAVFALQFLYEPCLVVRLHACPVMAYAYGRSHGARRLVVVACQHPDLYAALFQCGNRCRSIRLYAVCYAGRGQRSILLRGQTHHCHAFAGH